MLEKSCKEFSSSLSLLNSQKIEFIDKNRNLQQEIIRINQEFQDKTNAYNSEKATSLELSRKLALAQQQPLNDLDLFKLSQQINDQATNTNKTNQKMIEANDELSSLTIKGGQSISNFFKHLQGIREVLDEKGVEIMILRGLVSDLKNKSVYYPVKDDLIDEAVADYVNSKTEPLEITFIREEEGRYVFGTKRADIALENNQAIGKKYFSQSW